MIMERHFGNIEKADFIRILGGFIFVREKFPKKSVFGNSLLLFKSIDMYLIN